MTRFARADQKTQKAPHSATPWSQMVDKSAGDSSLHKTKPDNKSIKKNKKSQIKPTKSLSSPEDKFKSKGHKSVGQSSPQCASDEFSHDKKAKKRKGTPVDKESKGAYIKTQVDQVKSEMGRLTKEQENELSDFYRKDFRREERRVKRIDQRENDRICFNCRETGHDMRQCPKLKRDKEHGTGICFKCGSTEHGMQQCPARLPPGEFPFAKCFICHEKGHLSKQCPDNPRGLYPNGGCCNECGSVEHFRKDCPELQRKRGLQDLCLSTSRHTYQSADAEESLIRRPVRKRPSGPKVVKF